MKMRIGLQYRIILTLMTLGLLITPSSAWGASKTHFCIVYTNDVMGEVEPCG